MSGSEAEAALLKLPLELLGMIIPDPAKLHGVRVDDLDVKKQGWLALRTDWQEVIQSLFFGYYTTVGPQHTLQILRSLSQTCRALRALTLPLLWSVVHVKTVRELGQLRDVLREAPYIAPLIRHFTFLWDVNGDFDRCEPYADELGSTLDMAFMDRGALWQDARNDAIAASEAMGSDIASRMRFHMLEVGVRRCAYFFWDQIFYEPGHEPRLPRAAVCAQDCTLMSAPQQLRLIAQRTGGGTSFENGESSTGSYRGPNDDRSGPDGNGDDLRIRNPADYNACLGEVIAQLSSLEVFSWRCPVVPVPLSILAGLKNAKKLTKLHLTLQMSRKTASIVPFWELATSLESLSLSFRSHSSVETLAMPSHVAEALVETDEEVSIEELAAFAVPSTAACADARESLSTHLSVFYRTIITAAQGGRLKHMQLSEELVQKPFAIRALLPCWVGVEQWTEVASAYRKIGPPPPRKLWSVAASTLRIALAHASIWLPEAAAGTRNNRLLTRADVQSLLGFYSDARVPAFVTAQVKLDNFQTLMMESGVSQELIRLDPDAGTNSEQDGAEPEKPKTHPLLELYLPWLATDEKLAQQVADAWNTVVERGEADRVKCRCVLCVARQL